MKYLSLFSGIGGFELGIEKAYALSKAERQQQGKNENNLSGDGKSFLAPECIGYSEIDKYAIQIYQKHFPSHINYGDITKINERTLPDFDCLVGGFPCQAFSIAGKRMGFADTRGTLFFDIARILKQKQPRYLLLENVKGLLSHEGGNTFTTIISTLDELGYDLQWQVLNSKNHGVPQNRERVFIIGHLRGTPRPEVFPFGANGGEVDGVSGYYSNTLTARYYGAEAVGTYVGESELDAQEIRQLNQPAHSNDRVYGAEGISPTLNTMQGGNRQPFITDPQGRKNKQNKPSAVSPTLRAQTHGNQPVVNAVRRLTPTECERLQGFPDGWTEGVSDTQRYKCIGNAVTVNVIRDIMKQLVNF